MHLNTHLMEFFEEVSSFKIKTKDKRDLLSFYVQQRK
jgi:hypothetical protein